MIDLHCHMLPGIDDGASDPETALAMARIAADDGIQITACTPHIYPGLYENTGPGILSAVAQLRIQLDRAGIPLQLTHGADTHLAPDLISGLNNRRIPSLHGSRYFLLEPPHHVAPPRFEDTVLGLLQAGYVPVITHPERLTWIKGYFPLFRRLAAAGAWMQVTAGSLTGRFGSAAQYWGERLLDKGLIHILATDAHGVNRRPPLLAEGREVAAKRLGSEEANHLVETRPRGILKNLDPAQVPSPPGLTAVRTSQWGQRLHFVKNLLRHY